ncbi:MAG: 5-formyltetrahydrofolate cyclo-ligase [Oleiphilaceae bacterium]|nr:5-formyltetrahydrofolate cyclo-ligase [Oleiphilaceae bacterium]
MTSAPLDKASIRRAMRRKRQALNPKEQRTASLRAFHQLKQSFLLKRGIRLAVYLGNDGELDPRLFLNELEKAGIEIYLPVLHPLPNKGLFFARYRRDQAMRNNRYGIPEPDIRTTKSRSPRHLDAVLLPLVAFDKKGNRLGMGGGYYDKSFAFKCRTPRIGPRLFGLAHDFQRLELLPRERWDVPLRGVITDKAYYRFR